MAVDSNLMFYLAALALAGVTSGFAGGLFGIGGGLLRVPIFLYLFPAFAVAEEHVFHLAAGTSLALAIPTCLAASWRQWKDGNMESQLLKAWLPALLLGVGIGLVLSRWASGLILRVFFVAILLIQAVYFLMPNRPHVSDHLPGRKGLALLSSGIGAVSVLLGLSGGLLTTPALLAFGQSIHRAVALSSAGALVLSTVATVGMIVSGVGANELTPYSLGYVDLPAFAVMMPTVMLSAPVGVRLANRLPDRPLELIFGVCIVVLAIDMSWQVLNKIG